MRIGFIGGGYMGEAIIGALLEDGFVEARDVTVSDVAEARREQLASAYGVAVTERNADAVEGADLIVLAVKPQEFTNVAGELKGRLVEGQTVLTIMAGVPIAKVADALGHAAIVRVMPNTPASVGEAMSVWTASDAVSHDARDVVARMLGALGRDMPVSEEKYLDMATALNGSGPGFVFYVLEALIEGGVGVGLARKRAQELAVQTLLGSAVLARESGKSATELRQMVTSKGGTTAAGLQALEQAGVREALVSAVEAAYERAKELSA